jgi:hypothetical protein
VFRTHHPCKAKVNINNKPKLFGRAGGEAPSGGKQQSKPGMKIVSRFLIGALCAFVALPLWATSRECDVVFSPTVLVVKSKAPALVTLHANVPIVAVADLNSICLRIGGTTLLPEKIFADLCGDLVAKFDAEAVKDAAKLVLTTNKKAKVVEIEYALEVDGEALLGSFRLKVK